MTQTDPAPKKLRVLIADDVQETRRSVRLMLSLNPDVVVVAIAVNGRQAVEMAKEHHPDVLVMDVNMPELTGLAAFKAFSADHADRRATPVVRSPARIIGNYRMLAEH